MKHISRYSEGVRERMVQVVQYLNAYNPRLSNKKDLAKDFGMTEASIYRWINGNGWPTLENICHAVMKHGINPEWLLTGRGHMMMKEKDIEYNMQEILKQVSSLQLEIKKKFRK